MTIRICLLSMLFFSQTGFAVRGVCPEINSYFDAGVEKVNIDRHRFNRTIYFCKQNLAETDTTYAIKEEELLSGGSKAISQGNTSQNAPINSGSVNLAGFTPTNITLNNIQASFPSEGGDKSVFNFYTRIFATRSCERFGQQYKKIRNYLRNNPTTFVVDDGNQTVIADQSSFTSIAKVQNAYLTQKSSGKKLPATISFYHTNPTSGQYFTRFTGRYCWYGVGVKIAFKTTNTQIENPGDYEVNIGVLTR